MIAVLLERAGLDPSYLIGGDLNESGSGAKSGEGDLFVFEADESDGSFLLARPHIGVVTNVDVDHVDFYAGRPCRDRGGLRLVRDRVRSGRRVRRRLRACDRCSTGTDVRAVRYGVADDNDLVVSVDELGPEGAVGAGPRSGRGREAVDPAARRRRAQPAERGGRDRRRRPRRGLARRRGRRGRRRSPGSTGASSTEATRAGCGVLRRLRAHADGDGGHDRDRARRRRPGRLIALVQPHRYSRVQALWRELGASVAGADLVLVTDVYGAAQEPIPGVTGQARGRRRRSSRRPRPRSSTCPTAPRSSTTSSARSDRAISWSRWDVATSGCWATRRSSDSGSEA